MTNLVADKQAPPQPRNGTSVILVVGAALLTLFLAASQWKWKGGEAEFHKVAGSIGSPGEAASISSRSEEESRRRAEEQRRAEKKSRDDADMHHR